MKLDPTKAKRTRLQDANLREDRDDPKRVYLLEWGEEDTGKRKAKGEKECARKVEILFAEMTEETEKRFEFLADTFEFLSENGVSVPSVEERIKTEKELRLIVSYEGEGLADQLKDGRELDLSQVAEIFRGISKIEEAKSEFVPPRPLRKFFEKLEAEDVKIDPALKEPLGDLKVKLRNFLDEFGADYNYGWGVIDPDIINFTVDKEGKISLIDIDGLRKTYDYYYQAGYFWVSLERLKKASLVKTCREEFAEALDFSRPNAEKRFKLGKLGALSIGVFHNLRTPEEAFGRIEKIQKLLKIN